MKQENKSPNVAVNNWFTVHGELTRGQDLLVFAIAGAIRGA